MKSFHVALLVRRLGWSAVTLLAVSAAIFFAMEADINSLAVKVLGPYSTADQRSTWLVENGYDKPALARYVTWLFNFFRGRVGYSLRFRADVASLVMDRFLNSAILITLAMVLIVPSALILGTIAGMSPHSLLDRSLLIVSILSTSLPEFATAVFLTILFVYNLDWLPGTSSMIDGFNPIELILPTIVLWLFSMGYLMGITRTSVAQTMRFHHIRTAIMKGLPPRRVLTHHVLRNSMITPITVIFLLIPYMLSGLVVVEVFFAYKGLGSILLEAALNNDVFLVEACGMVTVIVVIVTQLLSDLAYILIDPRIRFSQLTT